MYVGTYYVCYITLIKFVGKNEREIAQFGKHIYH